MKNHWITTAAVAAIAGAAGASIALQFVPQWSNESEESGAVIIAPEADMVPDYGHRLAELERRLATVELRPVASVREVAAPIAEAVPETRVATTAHLAPISASAVHDAGFQDHVELALTRIREEERVAREAEKEAKRLEQVELQLAKLSDALGLGTDQVNDMRSLYESQRQAKLDMQVMWDDGFAREAVAQFKDESAARYRAELERILTPQQLDRFEMLSDNKQRRDRGRRDNDK